LILLEITGKLQPHTRFFAAGKANSQSIGIESEDAMLFAFK